MTDKEKLEKLKKLADAMYYAAQYLTTDASSLRKTMEDYRQFIINEYHKEEPVREDLEEATNNYCLNARKGYPRVKDETDRYICSAFKDGAQWQKEQMMMNAVECEYFDGSLFRNDLREKYRDCDKVKIVIVKSE